MKTTTARYSFAEILQRLAQQNPEEKLRITFNLWQFVKDLQAESNAHGKRKTNPTRATA